MIALNYWGLLYGVITLGEIRFFQRVRFSRGPFCLRSRDQIMFLDNALLARSYFCNKKLYRKCLHKLLHFNYLRNKNWILQPKLTKVICKLKSLNLIYSNEYVELNEKMFKTLTKIISKLI